MIRKGTLFHLSPQPGFCLEPLTMGEHFPRRTLPGWAGLPGQVVRTWRPEVGDELGRQAGSRDHADTVLPLRLSLTGSSLSPACLGDTWQLHPSHVNLTCLLNFLRFHFLISKKVTISSLLAGCWEG